MPEILFVFGGEQASGAEIVIERMIDADETIQPHLFVSPGKFCDRIKQKQRYRVQPYAYLKKLNRGTTSGAKFIMKAAGNMLGVSKAVLKYIRKEGITIVHANTVVPAFYLVPAVLWTKLFNRRITWVWSDHDLKYFSAVDTLFSKTCARFFHKTLVVSEAVKKKYASSLQQKIAVLYNGIDTGAYRPDEQLRAGFRSSYAIDENTIVLGMPASITPRKGQASLLTAFASLPPAQTGVKLLLAGNKDGNHPAYVEEVLAGLETTSGAAYIGPVSDMVSFYNGCDVVINNTTAREGEPLGTTIYEAMAYEKIVLASATGGTPEIITDREDGFIFPADERKALQDCLEYIIAGIDKCRDIRKKAREKVLQKFKIETMVAAYHTILQDLGQN